VLRNQPRRDSGQHIVVDAGALIALDRSDNVAWALFAKALERGARFVTHAGVLGQVWRKPARQVQLGNVVAGINVWPLTAMMAKEAGVLLAKSRTFDVNDAALALLCRPGDTLWTSDLEDLLLLLDAERIRDVTLVRF
jgi:hypothetical protein